VEVKVDSGRIRSAPHLEAPIQLGVSRGEQAVVLETEGKWRRIRLADGRTGWGHRMLFSRIGPVNPAGERFRPEPETPNKADDPKTAKTEVESATETEKASDEKTLRDIRVLTEEAGEETAVFQLSGFYPPETFVIEEGAPRVVCDFKGVRPGESLRPRIAVAGDMIQRIRTGVHANPESKLRVVVDLTRDRNYTVEQVFLKGKGQYILTFKTAEAAD
jgi:hypothetical protein